MIRPLPYFLILGSLLSEYCYAQNLVKNPSFESGDEHCWFTPNGSASSYVSYVTDWASPTDATPDVYSTEVETDCYAFMPNNTYSYPPNRIKSIGKQAPHSGKRFAGIFTYGPPFAESPFRSYREYLFTELTTPLIKGEKYCIEFFLSRAEGTRYAANNIGIYLSPYNLLKFNYSTQVYQLPFTAQILNTEIITDTVNWVRFSTVYEVTDDQPPGFLVIGNFFIDSETNVIDINKTDDRDNYADESAYYFIDDVSGRRF